jgi:hypothetical protein
MVGFLSLQSDKKNDILAGACAALTLIKPQAVYLFAAAVILWALYARRYKIILGLAGAVIGCTLLAAAVNPTVLQDYLRAVTTHSPSDYGTPTIGAWLRHFVVGWDAFWPQYIPAGFGLGWLVVYFVKNRSRWLWRERLPILLLVSAITVAFGWTYDQVVLLLVSISAFTILLNQAKPAQIAIYAGLYAALQLLLLLFLFRLNDFWTIWFSPALLLWYTASLRAAGRQAIFSRQAVTPGNPAG